jgi:hypothetical protein
VIAASSLATAGLLALANVPQAHALTPALSWLAAGDSYSSGEGLPHATGPCAQATPTSGSQAWAFSAYDILSKAGSPLAEPTLVACTGAKTSQFFAPAGSDPAEFASPDQRADLVTMTFGGDNIGFSPIIKQCIDLTRLSQVLRAIFEVWSPIGTSPVASDKNHTCPTDTSVRKAIAALGTTYPTFLTQVATTATAPGGNIVLLGYPDFVELPKFSSSRNQHLGSCFGIGTDDATLLRGWAGDLNATLGEAVKRFNAQPAAQRDNVKATFVDVNSGGGVISKNDKHLFEPSSGTRHNLCSSDSWLNGLTTIDHFNGSFHPKQPGANAQGALAAEVIAKLDWSRLAPQPFAADTGNFAFDPSFTNLQLDSVACPSDNSCLAAGDDYETGTGFTAVVEQWNGSSWAQMSLPNPEGIELRGISCPSASFCMAVGNTQFQGEGASPVAYTFNGQQWSNTSPPTSTVPAGDWGNLIGVSCASPTNCVAVGSHESADTSSSNPFIEQWSAGTWTSPSLGDSLYGELLGVSCSSSTDCTAVGAGASQEGALGGPAAYHLSGSAWANAPVPTPTADPDGQNSQGGSSYELHSVSCPSPASCTAVGDDGAAETWNGSTWALAPTDPGDYVSIDCTSTNRCLVAGTTGPNPGIEGGTAAGWQTVPQAASPSVRLEAVATRSDGFSMTVGYDTGPEVISPYAEAAPST